MHNKLRRFKIRDFRRKLEDKGRRPKRGAKSLCLPDCYGLLYHQRQRRRKANGFFQRCYKEDF